MNILYMGTPDFSVPTLEVLANHSLVKNLLVISMPDRPAGRGKQLKSPEVIEYCKKNKIPFIQSENINKDQEALKKIQDFQPDLSMVLAFAQFLGQPILDLPAKGCFNIHTSLLPKYRGAAPIQYAILNGDTQTGVSIQRMVKKMDAGDVCWSHKLSIYPNETGGELYQRLKFQAALCAHEFLYALKENQLVFAAQNESQVSFAPSLSRDQGKLDFTKSASELHNQVRALYPWPGTYCEMNGERLKVLESEICERQEEGKLIIPCADKFLRLKKVQLPGKRSCSDLDLLRGLREKPILR